MQNKFNRYTKQLVLKSVALTIVAETIAPLPLALIQDRCPGALEERCYFKPPSPRYPPSIPLYGELNAISTVSSTANTISLDALAVVLDGLNRKS